VRVTVRDMETWASSDTSPPVTYFVLHVCIGASSYCVRRRFKDFDALYTCLCNAYGKQNVPGLPPKQVIKNENTEFLAKRRELLAEFVAAVLDDKVLSMSAELCAFLECEAGAQLTKANADLSSCTAMLVSEVGAAEALAAAASTAASAAAAELAETRDALARETAAREAAEAERDAALRAAQNARERALAMLCRGRDQRLASQAFGFWATSTAPKPAAPKQPPADVGAALSAALSAALHAVGPKPPAEPALPTAAATDADAASEPTSPLGGDEPAVRAELAALAGGVPPPASEPSDGSMPYAWRPSPQLKSPPSAPPPPAEIALKVGLLHKQGAGNKAFVQRYFELVSLGEYAEYGAFLVYYESELKASVKGYISLEGASVTRVEHNAEAHAFTLTTPARRLSMLTPGLMPGPLKMGDDGKLVTTACPPSLDARMSIIEKLDNWGRHALRNMLAEGPMNAPVTTWTLAAHSAPELESWLASFRTVLGEVAPPHAADVPAGVGAHGYVPIGAADGGRAARTPTLLTAEEVA
jgi:hypothetical protein